MSIVRLVKYAASIYKLYRMDEKIRELAELQGKRNLLVLALGTKYPNEKEFFERMQFLSGKPPKEKMVDSLVKSQIKNREKNLRLAKIVTEPN